MKDRTGWRALFEWSIVFAIATLSLLGMASIGMFIAPVAVGAGVIVARRNRLWPESFFGGVFGFAVVILVVGLGYIGSTPCPEGPSVSVVMPGESGGSCGGRDPMPWLTTGTAIAALGLVGFAILRGTHRRVAA